MGSSWILLESAVRAEGQDRIEAFSQKIVANICNGEIASRADIISHSHLTSLTIYFGDHAASEATYLANSELLKLDHREIQSLETGLHHKSIEREKFTILREADKAILYWPITSAKTERRVELTGSFWKNAIIEHVSSFAIADDLISSTRSTASGITLSAADLEYLWPMHFGREAPSTIQSRRPRKRKHDKDGAMAALAQFVREQQITSFGDYGVKARLEKYVMNWFNQQNKKEPFESQVRTWVTEFISNR